MSICECVALCAAQFRWLWRCALGVRVGRHEIYKFIPCQVHIYNKMYNASKLLAMFYGIHFGVSLALALVLSPFFLPSIYLVLSVFVHGFVFISRSLLYLFHFGCWSVVKHHSCSFCVYNILSFGLFYMSQWIFRCVCSLNIFNITNAQILVHHVDIELKRSARRTTIKQIMAFSSLSVSCSGEFNSDFAIYATFNRLLNFLAKVVCVWLLHIYSNTFSTTR